MEQFAVDMSGEGFGYILVFDVVAITDLNGDGRMEVVIDRGDGSGLRDVTVAPVGSRAAMSTRRLIFAALLCGLAILVAFSVQLVQMR